MLNGSADNETDPNKATEVVDVEFVLERDTWFDWC